MSARNLVLCFDGTNNQFGPENTNVIRLVQLVDRDSAKQRLYYDPGVGTLPEPGVTGKVRSAWSKIKGLGFGAGLLWKVQEAYSFLMQYWEPGDRVYMFGFSRGAYTARVLAGLLHALGLLPRGNYNLIPYVLRYFQQLRDDNGVSGAEKTKRWKAFCQDFRQTFGRQIESGDQQRYFQVHFMGLWDTVSSVGWVWDPKHFPYTAYNPSIRHIRHAVSIDERRAFFRQNLFRSKKDQDLVELWFPGAHCDVGGGYPRAGGRLWWTPFFWILEEAEKHSLLIDATRKAQLQSDAPAAPWAEPINNSLTWKWLIGEIWPKFHYTKKLPRPNFGSSRQMKSGSRLHYSALRRIRDADPEYRPAGVPAAFWINVNLTNIPDDLQLP